MQVSPVTMEREYEALRDIKRHSTAHGGPGTLVLDPDLPATQPKSTAPLSPQAWAADGDSSAVPARSHEDDEGANEDTGTGADDPIQLFWVPAHLHPELAPSEFRAFLKDHARAPADGTTSLERSSSAASSLGRKRSMLSRQYKPRDNDDAEEEKVVPLRRNKSIFQHEGPQLTISDLQKLEELADRAAKSEDPTQLRRLLRRSMSLNVAPSCKWLKECISFLKVWFSNYHLECYLVLDQMDDVPDATDDADAPIIVPPPNQILRRTARTKIRKPNLSGDGGGHRFPASRASARRKSAGRANSVDAVIISPTESSSSGHGEIDVSLMPPIPTRKRTIDTEDLSDNRRFTYTEESSIFDAYADTPEDEKPPSPQALTPATPILSEPSSQPPVSTITSPTSTPSPSFTSEPAVNQQISSQPPAPVLHQPQPVKQLSPQQQVIQQPSRTPSPDGSSTAPSSLDIQRPDSRSSVTSEAPSHMSASSASADKRKEKDKKSLWKKVGGGSDKQSKKNGKEKDTGFFGSLFGGKKKQEEPPSSMGGGAGPATAAALLGASKSNKGYSPSVSPQLGNPYARYPIHVERAVYRLSHIKLANPRRPLYEQVLISNLMFWYLGVINKANQPPAGQNQNQQVQNQQAGAQPAQRQTQENGQNATPPASEKEHLEREQREREERERAERERMEAKEKAEQRREPKRGTLTKPPPGGAGSRRAEMPVKGPQYHIQSQAIEQEYGGGSGSSPTPRPPSAPPSSSSTNQNYGGGYQQRGQPVQQQQQQQQSYGQPNGNQNYYYSRSGSLDLGSSQPQSTTSNLPPGAMPPLSSNEQLWLAATSGPLAQNPSGTYQHSQGSEYSQNHPPSRNVRTSSSNNYHNSSNSLDWGRGNDSQKTPMRSLSANAVVPPSNQQYGNQYYGQGNHQGAGGLKKKMASASAVSPDRRQQVSEDEDVPLAMWQQQRRR